MNLYKVEIFVVPGQLKEFHMLSETYPHANEIAIAWKKKFDTKLWIIFDPEMVDKFQFPLLRAIFIMDVLYNE